MYSFYCDKCVEEQCSCFLIDVCDVKPCEMQLVKTDVLSASTYSLTFKEYLELINIKNNIFDKNVLALK